MVPGSKKIFGSELVKKLLDTEPILPMWQHWPKPRKIFREPS